MTLYNINEAFQVVRNRAGYRVMNSHAREMRKQIREMAGHSRIFIDDHVWEKVNEG